MNEKLSKSDDYSAVRSSSPSRLKRTRRALFPTFGALTALLTLGLVAPPAMAVDATSGAVYELTVNGETVILEEGESVEFGMRALSPQPEPGKVMPMAIYTSNAGTLTVTGAKGKFNYGIAMSIPARSFGGIFTVTNLTNGQSGGRVPV